MTRAVDERDKQQPRSKAHRLCALVAGHLNADAELRKAMLEAAQRSPERAAICYKAMLNSYKREKA